MTTSGKSVQRRILVSTVAQISSQLLIAGLGVITLKLITNNLGMKDYGVYATILAFVSTFSLLTDLGLNAITGREIAKYPEKADEIIGQNIGLRMFLCLVMVPVIFGLSFVFYPHATSQLRYGILLLTAFLFFDAIRSVTIGYFTAKVRNDITAVINSLQQILVTLLVVGVIFTKLGLFGFIFAYIISNTISMIATLLIVRREVSIRPRINILKWRAIMVMSLSLGVIQLINMMYLKADSIMLSVFKGTSAVGIYGIAYSLILAFLALPSFIMTALIPSMATSTAKTITPIVQKAYQYMVLFACLLAAGALIVRHEIILTVTSKSFAAAALPFAILGFATAFSFINNVFGFASVSLNKHHRMIYVSAAALLLNIIMNFILIPLYSFNGAAWATLVSELVALVGVYLVFRKDTGVHIKIFRYSWRPIVVATALVPLLYCLDFLWSTSNHLVNLLIASVIIVLGYVVLLATLRGLPAEVSTAFGEVRAKIKRAK